MLFRSINVHGFNMFLYPYQNMGDTLMLSNIMEWFPTVLSDASHYPYFILAVFILFVFIFSKKKIQFIDFVLFGVSLFLGLKSIRFWPFMYIIMSFVVFDYVDKRKLDKNAGVGILLLSCSLVLFCITNFPKLSLSTDLLDDKVISILKKENPKRLDRKSTRLNSSHVSISYAVFCLKKKKNKNTRYKTTYTQIN